MDLEEKILLSRLFIKDAASKYNKKQTNVLWSGGKDSTLLLHLIRKTLHTIPFRIVRIDTGVDFPEVCQFVKKIQKDWNLKLDILQLFSKKEREKILATNNEEGLKKHIREKRDIVIKKYIEANSIAATFSGVRWYESFHNVNQFWGKNLFGVNMIYPLLHWAHGDIWEYTHLYKVPYVSLYDEGHTHLDSLSFSHICKENRQDESIKNQ